MNKRFSALLLSVLIVCTVFCGCRKVEYNPANNGTANNNRVTYETADINVRRMADNIDTWIIDISLYADNPATTFNYCITDLDQNGRLEMFTTVGYSNVTEIKLYEVNEDLTGLTLVESVTDSSSDADVNDLGDGTCYKDAETGRIYYMYMDQRNEQDKNTGVVNKYTSKVALSLFEGKLYQETLATRSVVRTEDGTEAEVVYTDAQGATITEEDFENIEATLYGDMEKKTVTMKWKGTTASNHSKNINLASNDLIILLSDSFEKFSID